MALKRVTTFPDVPVTLAEAKEHLRIDDTDSDSLITRLLKALTVHLDGWDGVLGMALKPQDWDLVFDDFPAAVIEIPLGPLISVDSVNYVDPDTQLETILASSEYEVDTTSDPGWVVPGDAGWPTPFETINAVRIRFTAGHADSDGVTTVPEDIRQAILMAVGHWYENREAVNIGNIVNSLPIGFDALVDSHRRVGF